MAGQHSEYEGGGNEHLCLTDKPEWGKDGTSLAYSTYGVEYKSGEELFDKDNAEKLINHDAVCAVCRSARSVQVICLNSRLVKGTSKYGLHGTKYIYLVPSSPYYTVYILVSLEYSTSQVKTCLICYDVCVVLVLEVYRCKCLSLLAKYTTSNGGYLVMWI